MNVVVRVALWVPLVVCVGCLSDLEVECHDADDCPAVGALCVGGACTAGVGVDDARPPDAERDGRPAVDVAVGDVAVGDDGLAPDRGDCVPASETCNALDDDCDGVVDEGPEGAGLTRNCYEGPVETQRVGACSVGTSTCMGGMYGPCDGQVLPTPEACEPRDADGCDAVCNNIDEDCDGVVDEGLVRDCYAEEGQTALGECEAGSQMCESGGWSECVGQVPPSVEICDGLDNDCDGVEDNVDGATCECTPGEMVVCYGGEPDTENVGPCVAGTQTCTEAGMFGECVGQRRPGVEVCNGVDDDCDGPTDENLGGEGCVAGVGACVRPGMRVCEPERGLVCNAVPGMPGDEVCNGVDDNCNGAVDEGTGGAACLVDGERCQPGELVCTAMGTLVCQPNGAPVGTPEVCNDIDDDCDDRVDELDGGRRCVCLPGDSQPCYDGEDGSLDVGACRGGTQDCEVMGDGSTDWGACVGQTLPMAEECDGVDRDCDGVDDADDGDIVCPDGPVGAAGVCNGRACVFECPPGLDDDGDPANGCVRGCGARPMSVEIPGAAPLGGYDLALAARDGTDSWAAAWVAAANQVQFSHRTGPGVLFAADPEGRDVRIVGIELIGVEQGYSLMVVVEREDGFGAVVADIALDAEGTPMLAGYQLFFTPTRPILLRRPVADGPDRQLVVWAAPNEEVVVEEGAVLWAHARTFGDADLMAGGGVALGGAQPGWDGWPGLAGAVSGDGAVIVGTCGEGAELCALRVDAASQSSVALPAAVREVPSRLVADGHPVGVVAGFMAGPGDDTLVLSALVGDGPGWLPPLLDDLGREVGAMLFGNEGPIALALEVNGAIAAGQAVLYGLPAGEAPVRLADPFPMIERGMVRSFVGVMVEADRRVAWIQRGMVRTTVLPCR